jgi:porin
MTSTQTKTRAPLWVGAVAAAVLALGASQARAQSAYLVSLEHARDAQDQIPTLSASDASQAPADMSGLVVNPAQSSSDNQGYLFNLQYGKSFGQTLANYGIYIDGSYVNITNYNAGGGIRNGAASDGDATLGINLDMQKILGVQGAQVHFYVDDRQGPNPWGKWVGTNFDDITIYGPNAAFRLGELDWDQSLFNDHLRILVGRINDLGDFDIFDFSCNFVDYICANTAWFYFDDFNAAFPVSSWGARVSLKPTLQTYIRIAAEATASDSYYNANYEGWNLSMTHDDGVFVPVEAGYKTDFSSSAYPSQYDIGGFYNSFNRQQTEFIKGSPVNPIGTGVLEGVWAQAAQMVYRPDMNSKRGITVFGEIEALVNSGKNPMAPNGVVPIQDQITGGIVWRGPAASRPNDTLNFAAEYFRINAAGAYQNVAPTMEMYQVNYHFVMAPGVDIAPYYLYIVNPQGNMPNSTQRIKNASEVGGYLTIVLPDLLGLPTLARVN